MPFYTPPVLNPRSAAVIGLIGYGVFAIWHVFKAWSYVPLIAPGLAFIGASGFIFIWIAGYVFPRLKKKDLPKRKWLYRSLFFAGLMLFTLTVILIKAGCENIAGNIVDFPSRADAADYKAWKAQVRSLANPVGSAGCLTSSLLWVTARFFRPDPPAGPAKSEGRQPPPLPLADGMKSRVVTDRWWEKYH